MEHPLHPALHVDLKEFVCESESKKHIQFKVEVSPPLENNTSQKTKRYETESNNTIIDCLQTFIIYSKEKFSFWELTITLYIFHGKLRKEAFSETIELIKYLGRDETAHPNLEVNFKTKLGNLAGYKLIIDLGCTKPIHFDLPYKYRYKDSIDLHLKVEDCIALLKKQSHYFDRSYTKCEPFFLCFNCRPYLCNLPPRSENTSGKKKTKIKDILGHEWSLIQNDAMESNIESEVDRISSLQDQVDMMAEDDNISIQSHLELIHFEHHIDQLPDECLTLIFNFMDPVSRGSAVRVCKRWRNIFKLKAQQHSIISQIKDPNNSFDDRLEQAKKIIRIVYPIMDMLDSMFNITFENVYVSSTLKVFGFMKGYIHILRHALSFSEQWNRLDVEDLSLIRNIVHYDDSYPKVLPLFCDPLYIHNYIGICCANHILYKEDSMRDHLDIMAKFCEDHLLRDNLDEVEIKSLVEFAEGLVILNNSILRKYTSIKGCKSIERILKQRFYERISFGLWRYFEGVEFLDIPKIHLQRVALMIKEIPVIDLSL